MTAVKKLFVSLAGSNLVMQGLLSDIVIAGMNMPGALLTLIWRDPSKRSFDALLGFTADVMLTASFTGLVFPGIRTAGGSPIPVLIGSVIGVVVLGQANLWIPHVRILVTDKARADAPETDKKMASVVLFIVATTIRSTLEGFAVGVGFDSGDLGTAVPLILTIGIQNIPRGLTVFTATVNAGLRSTIYAAFTGICTGLVGIPLAVFDAWAIRYATALLPYTMGFAAGTVLFVIPDEIVPKMHSNGHERVATFGTMVGVVVMLYPDVTLG